jgi:hypothetical protein
MSLVVGAGGGAAGGAAGKAGVESVAEQKRAAEMVELRRQVSALRERAAEAETAAQLAEAKARRALVLGEDNDEKLKRMQRDAIVVKPER